MSREGIVGDLQTREIEVTSLVYSQSKVTVYRGMYRGSPAAIKVLHAWHKTDPLALESEYQALLTLDHPSILKVYDSCWLPEDTYDYFIIVTEWCPKDLWKDIQDRKAHEYPFSEQEIWEIMYKLVDAYSYMQEHHYAHRDIKPDNIFLYLDNTLRVGDLGCARYIPCTPAISPVLGTPIYLSPILRSATEMQRTHVVHDVFKSDVYSLGLTLLSLAILQRPLWTNLNESIDSIAYSNNLKDTIKWMVSEDEKVRGDFLDWKQWLMIEEKRDLDGSEMRESLETTSKKPKNKKSHKLDQLLPLKPHKIDKFPTVQKQKISKTCVFSASTSKISRKIEFNFDFRQKFPLNCTKCEAKIDYFSNFTAANCEIVEHIYCSEECKAQEMEFGCSLCQSRVNLTVETQKNVRNDRFRWIKRLFSQCCSRNPA